MTSAISLYAVRDKGYLHIAHEKNYQGKINSYNNFITKFFSQLFRISIDITINNKHYLINKKSHIKFLTPFTEEKPTTKNLQLFRNLTTVIVQPHKDKGFMRSYLSQSKKEKLEEKFINIIVKKNPNESNEKAIKLLHKGAPVDTYFWKYRHSLLPKIQVSYPGINGSGFVNATKYTPLLFSIEKKNVELANILLEFQADTTLEGKGFDVSKEKYVETRTIERNVTREDEMRTYSLRGNTYSTISRSGIDSVQQSREYSLETFSNTISLTFDGVENPLKISQIPDPTPNKVSDFFWWDVSTRPIY